MSERKCFSDAQNSGSIRSMPKCYPLEFAPTHAGERRPLAVPRTRAPSFKQGQSRPTPERITGVVRLDSWHLRCSCQGDRLLVTRLPQQVSLAERSKPPTIHSLTCEKRNRRIYVCHRPVMYRALARVGPIRVL
jgi:hypothetical protein